MLRRTCRQAARLCVAPRRRGGGVARALSGGEDRDVEKKKTENEMVALLRRIADSVEANESWRIQVDGTRLTVPEDAAVSVEHEREGSTHEVELQFKWTART